MSAAPGWVGCRHRAEVPPLRAAALCGGPNNAAQNLCSISGHRSCALDGNMCQDCRLYTTSTAARPSQLAGRRRRAPAPQRLLEVRRRFVGAVGGAGRAGRQLRIHRARPVPAGRALLPWVLPAAWGRGGRVRGMSTGTPSPARRPSCQHSALPLPATITLAPLPVRSGQLVVQRVLPSPALQQAAGLVVKAPASVGSV